MPIRVSVMRVDELPSTIAEINAVQKTERTRRRWAAYQRIEDVIVWFYRPTGLRHGATYSEVVEGQRAAAKRRG